MKSSNNNVENCYIKEKFIWKVITFLLLCIVRIIAICNNAFSPPYTETHSRQSIFSWIVFVNNKAKRAKRKTYKPVPLNVGSCRILKVTNFFHSRLHSCQYLSFFIWHERNADRVPEFEKIPTFGRAKST